MFARVEVFALSWVPACCAAFVAGRSLFSSFLLALLGVISFGLVCAGVLLWCCYLLASGRIFFCVYGCTLITQIYTLLPLLRVLRVYIVHVLRGCMCIYCACFAYCISLFTGICSLCV